MFRLRIAACPVALLALGSMAAVAQVGQPMEARTVETGSVSGHIFDADSGAPLQGFPMEKDVRTDAQGRYTLRLPAGPQQIALYGQRMWPSLASRLVTVEAGKELDNFDFRVRLDGEIAGRVVDDNQAPVAGIPVRLIGREYYAGALRYFSEGSSTTNDRGEFALRNVRAGRSLLLLVESAKIYKSPISDVPAKLALRKPAYRATYFPNAASVEGATPLTLRSGEHREGVEIRVLRSPSYCVEAVLTDSGLPASLNLKVTDELTSSANITPGSASSGPPGVRSGPDGKIRICDLYPGRFRIAAFLRGTAGIPELFGAATVAIGNDDVRNIKVAVERPATLHGEVEWDGALPDLTTPAELSFGPQAVTNDSMPGRSTRSPIPGQFFFSGLPSLEYAVRMSIGPPSAFPNAYIKDATYGNLSVFHQSLKIGGEGDARLRITVANDGGFIRASTIDKDGKVAGGAHILILPEGAATEAILTDALVSGDSGAGGVYSSKCLAPGKYKVLATNDLVDNTPESIGRVWRARPNAQQVEVAPKATVQVTLEPKPLN